MKRLIAAAIIAAIVAVIHFTGNIYIKNVIKECNVQLETIVADYKRDISPKENAEKLRKYWGEKEDFLSVFARHDNIDEIELAIDTLAVYSETKDSEIFYEYSGTVKSLLHQLYEDDSFSMHSIL